MFDLSYRTVGGLNILKISRVCVSFSVSRPGRQFRAIKGGSHISAANVTDAIIWGFVSVAFWVMAMGCGHFTMQSVMDPNNMFSEMDTWFFGVLFLAFVGAAGHVWGIAARTIRA